MNERRTGLFPYSNRNRTTGVPISEFHNVLSHLFPKISPALPLLRSCHQLPSHLSWMGHLHPITIRSCLYAKPGPMSLIFAPDNNRVSNKEKLAQQQDWLISLLWSMWSVSRCLSILNKTGTTAVCTPEKGWWRNTESLWYQGRNTLY